MIQPQTSGKEVAYSLNIISWFKLMVTSVEVIFFCYRGKRNEHIFKKKMFQFGTIISFEKTPCTVHNYMLSSLNECYRVRERKRSRE